MIKMIALCISCIFLCLSCSKGGSSTPQPDPIPTVKPCDDPAKKPVVEATKTVTPQNLWRVTVTVKENKVEGIVMVNGVVPLNNGGEIKAPGYTVTDTTQKNVNLKFQYLCDGIKQVDVKIL